MRCIQTLIAIVLLFVPVVFGENALYRAEHIMQCGSWELVFYESGYAHESWNKSCGEESESFSRLHRLSSKQLDSIRKALSQAKFAELPDSIEPATYVADEDMYVIHTYRRGSSKRVSVLGLERAINREVAGRFS